MKIGRLTMNWPSMLPNFINTIKNPSERLSRDDLIMGLELVQGMQGSGPEADGARLRNQNRIHELETKYPVVFEMEHAFRPGSGIG